jgi:hypothetical protein
MIPHVLSYTISSHSPTPIDEALNARFVCSKTTTFDAILGSLDETGNIGFLSETRGSSSLIGRPYVRGKGTPRKVVAAAFIPDVLIRFLRSRCVGKGQVRTRHLLPTGQPPAP